MILWIEVTYHIVYYFLARIGILILGIPYLAEKESQENGFVGSRGEAPLNNF